MRFTDIFYATIVGKPICYLLQRKEFDSRNSIMLKAFLSYFNSNLCHKLGALQFFAGDFCRSVCCKF